jgi:phage-related minor tail protein
MHQQLIKYQIQINSLKEKISLLKQYISTENNFNLNQQQIDQSAINTFQTFAQYFRNQIDNMKQQIQTMNHND